MYGDDQKAVDNDQDVRVVVGSVQDADNLVGSCSTDLQDAVDTVPQVEADEEKPCVVADFLDAIAHVESLN